MVSVYDKLTIITLSITFISMGLVVAIYESHLSGIMEFLSVVAVIVSMMITTVVANTFL